MLGSAARPRVCDRKRAGNGVDSGRAVSGTLLAMTSGWRNRFLWAMCVGLWLGLRLSQAVADPAQVRIQSVPLPAPPSAPSVPISVEEYSRIGSGRLSLQAKQQLLRFLGALPGPAMVDGAGRLKLLVQHSERWQSLAQRGVSSVPLSPSISLLSVSKEGLLPLLLDPTVRRIDGPRRLRPLLDQSRQLIYAQSVSEKRLLTGKGVMIGVVDTGIDFRHADLRDATGKTKIAYLISRSERRDGRHPELPDYDGMQVLTAKDIDEVLDYEKKGMQPPIPIREQDINGHGTHVAGIAASTGLATSPKLAAGRYVGIAPDATLCFAKATADEVSFEDADILLGVRFCMDRADADKVPLVVNLSLGSDGGSHDGTSLLELALDELFAQRPGRILVSAAGNSGDLDIHAGASLLSGSHEITIQLRHFDIPVSETTTSLELYYDAAAPPLRDGSANLTLSLRSPSGRLFEVPMGQSLRATFEDEGEAVIDASDVAETGLRGVLISIFKPAGQGAPKEGDWRLTLRGQTRRYDLWKVLASDDLDVQLRGHLDPDGYIAIPAGARSAISVGAQRSRLSWLRADGKLASFDRELHRVATFSSGGPLRDGRFAPDVLAPGEFIISALSTAALQSDPRSSFALPHDPGLLIADDALHGVLRGTSQATPHIAGAVALLLQFAPLLTTTDVRELLRTTSALPSQHGYGPRHGFGLVNLESVFHRLTRGPLFELSPLDSDVGVNRDLAAPGVDTVTVTVTPRDLLGRPLGAGLAVAISTDHGEWISDVRDEGHGRYERTLLAKGPRGTAAHIEVRVGGVLLSQQPVIHFVGERSEIGQPFVIAACSVGQGGASGSPLALWLVLLPLCGLLLRRSASVKRLLALGLWALWGCSDSTDSASNVRFSTKDKGGDFFWAVRGELLHPRLLVHLDKQQADLFDGEQLVGQSSICSGRASHKTPKGSFAVLEKAQQYVSGRYGDYVTDMGEAVLVNIDNHDQQPPPGTTFRGTPMPYFMRIFGGIGLHAGPLVGHPDSHGCVRFPLRFAKLLFDAVPLGTKVDVGD